MKIKEQVIRESMKRIKIRLKQIDNLSNARPVSDLVDLQKETAEKLRGKVTSVDALSILKKACAKESRLRRLFKKQCDRMIPDMDEEFELKSQLEDLENELFMMKAER